VLLLSHAGGSALFTLVIPAAPSLAGITVGAQALVFDALAPSAIGAVTNAGILRVH
jgi:hypothetical protein